MKNTIKLILIIIVIIMTLFQVQEALHGSIPFGGGENLCGSIFGENCSSAEGPICGEVISHCFVCAEWDQSYSCHADIKNIIRE